MLKLYSEDIYIQRGKKSISQLCEEAGINRSTFYRHYRDVYDLMDRTEREIQQGLIKSLAIEKVPVRR